MWNNTNPAELFSGTTWELITSGKYIQSGSTALSTGGSNSVAISKANLPNVKLKIDTVSATLPAHKHTARMSLGSGSNIDSMFANYGGTGGNNQTTLGSGIINTGAGGSGNTGTISPNTEILGSGTALSIQPSYITLKFWKRLS